MKTILVPTDFSDSAENAARYALNIARVAKANIRLFNTFMVPGEAPLAPQVSWPLVDYSTLSKNTLDELDKLARKLKTDDQNYTGCNFHPVIEGAFDVGNTVELVNDIVERNNISMVVMGMSGVGGIKRFFLGSTSRDMIENTRVPLLLVPAYGMAKPIDEIAFATDLSTGDIDVIQSLVNFARHFDAEILISHITDDKYEGEYKKRAEAFMENVHRKVNYSKMEYKHVKSMDVDHGLEWLTENSKADILAMVHHKYNWLESLFHHSHTQETARNTEIPLLVFPAEGGKKAFADF